MEFVHLDAHKEGFLLMDLLLVNFAPWGNLPKLFLRVFVKIVQLEVSQISVDLRFVEHAPLVCSHSMKEDLRVIAVWLESFQTSLERRFALIAREELFKIKQSHPYAFLV